MLFSNFSWAAAINELCNHRAPASATVNILCWLWTSFINLIRPIISRIRVHSTGIGSSRTEFGCTTQRNIGELNTFSIFKYPLYGFKFNVIYLFIHLFHSFIYSLKYSHFFIFYLLFLFNIYLFISTHLITYFSFKFWFAFVEAWIFEIIYRILFPIDEFSIWTGTQFYYSFNWTYTRFVQIWPSFLFHRKKYLKIPEGSLKRPRQYQLNRRG